MSDDFQPPFSPLLVRSPSFNGWLPRAGSSEKWPREWSSITGKNALGLAGIIRVDNVSYTWMGDAELMGPGQMPVLSQTMTPTSTIRILGNDEVNLRVEFLSPIEADDVNRQSFPFSYISAKVTSNDGNPHNVQLYMDMQAQWATYGLSKTLVLSVGTHKQESNMYFHASKKGQEAMARTRRGRASDTTMYFGMPLGPEVSFDIASEVLTRAAAMNTGALNSTEVTGDLTADVPSDGTPLSFAFLKDLGNVGADPSSALFAIGVVRDPSITYAGSLSVSAETRMPCFRTAFENVGAALTEFLDDFSSAKSRANDLDKRLTELAQGISDQALDLVSMSTRSVMASMDITCGLDPNDVMFFVNSMNSRHESSGIYSDSNRVEDLFAAWPAIMAINATYGRYILEPLLRFQNAEQTRYALPDLGDTYPIVTGRSPEDIIDAEGLGVEESGNMLLMVWAQVRFSGERALLDEYYTLLKRWADYLPNAIPRWGGSVRASNADGDASTNTNLALKGILGIRAMAELAWLRGNIVAADGYSMKAASLYEEWKANAFHDDRLLLQYNFNESWGLMYNMYPDKWLGLNLVTEDIYTAQEGWYRKKLTEYSSNFFTLPYDNSKEEIKTHWTSLTAATIESTEIRDLMLGSLHRHALSDAAALFPSNYTLNSTGLPVEASGQGSILLGAMFAAPALNLPVVQEGHYTASAVDPSSQSGPPPRVAALAGGIIGAIAFLLLILGVFLWTRKKSSANKDIDKDSSYSANAISPFLVMPIAHGGTNSLRGTNETRIVPARVEDVENRRIADLQREIRELRLGHDTPPPSYTSK